MRPDLSELHIYVGILVAAVGAGIAFGLGIGLIVFGVGIVPVGALMAMAPAEPPKVKDHRFDPLIMAGQSDVDDEAA